jgi:hypothetical protein
MMQTAVHRVQPGNGVLVLNPEYLRFTSYSDRCAPIILV